MYVRSRYDRPLGAPLGPAMKGDDGVCVCVHARVRACARASVWARVRVRACVGVLARMCARARGAGGRGGGEVGQVHICVARLCRVHVH